MLDLRSINLGLAGGQPDTQAAAHITNPSLTGDDMTPNPAEGEYYEAVAQAPQAAMPGASAQSANAGQAQDAAVSDFGVAPFDITDFHLDAEDRHTGSLNTGLLHRESEEFPDKIFTG